MPDINLGIINIEIVIPVSVNLWRLHKEVIDVEVISRLTGYILNSKTMLTFSCCHFETKLEKKK